MWYCVYIMMNKATAIVKQAWKIPVMLYLTIGLLGGVLLVVSGCEQAPPPPPPPAKVEKTEPPPATENEAAVEESDPEETPVPVYEYDPIGRREPFESLVAEDIPDAPDVLVTPDPAEIQTPLQEFDVKQLKIIGIIMGNLGDYARIVAPDGKSYTINVGTPIGINDGEVVSITENAIIVRETLRYESGKVEVVETPLYLNPIEEEKS